MKKYFLSLVAMAAAMLFATSCQESLVEPQVGGTTTFTVQLPDGMGTKAIGDEASTQATINRLYVEVYSEDGTTLVYEPSVITMNNAAATVKLNLVSTQKYDIIFWAQNEFCTYDVTDLRSVKMNANHHNSETGAAFYAVLNDYTPINGQQGVTLTRPFAQLNLATTTKVSYANGTNNKVTIESAKITVKGVAPSFDRINGQTNGEGYAPALSNEVTYTYENTDATTNFPKAAGEIEVAGEKYQYVSMDYFAVPGNQSTVQVTAEIKVKDPNGVESTITRVIESVPVQLNYKTNIVGNLITSATEFEVIVEEAWKGTNDKEVEFREVATAEELQDAIDAGVDNITLTDDITLDQPLVFVAPSSQSLIARASTNETSFVLDLNGKNLKGSISVDRGVDLIVNNGNIVSENPSYSGIVSNGDLTLNNVNITSARHALRIESGKAVINGGEYKVEPKAGTSMTVHALNVGDDNTYAEVLIENGTFIGPRGTNGESGSAVQVRNGSKVTIENGVFSGGKNKTLTANQEDLVVKGGEFDQNPASWVAEGYKAVEVAGGESFVVLPATENYDIVITDPTQLTKGMLDANEDILLQLSAGEYTIDLYMSESSDANLTIVGTKGTKVKFANIQVRLQLFNNFTIKNCEILRMPDKKWGMLVFGSGNKKGGKYTIENCTFNGDDTQGIYINEEISGAEYNIINCTFNGNFGAQGAITIETNKDFNYTVNVIGCEFNDVPANHRIFLTPDTSNGPLSYDFTLNTDLEVSTATELVMFLSLSEDVVFANDIKIDPANMSNAYGKTGINVKNGQEIDGNGYTLNIKGAGGTWDSGINTTGGLIKNITVTGSFRGIFINHNSTYSERVVLDNVTIQGTTYTISCDKGMNQGLTATNSTFNGWTSYAKTLGEAEFINCSFGAGNGYKFCRPYAPTTFVGCDFCEGYTVDPENVVTFENCTINGVALTAENISNLVTSTEKVTVN